MKRSKAAPGSLARAGLAFMCAGLLGVTACDDPNRFRGGGIQGPGGSQADPPTVTIAETRSSVPLGDSILVEAAASDAAGIVSMTFVGRTLRGDPDLGTDESVVRFESKTVELTSEPTDTTIARFLQPVEGEETRETTWIVVESTDIDGNVGVDSVSVILGGPAVEFLDLSDPVSGTNLPIRLRASDPTGVSSVRIEVAGAIDTTLAREFGASPDTAVLDTLLFIPPGSSGALDFLGEAGNTRGVSGTTALRTLQITQGGGADATPPTVSLATQSDRRLEVQTRVPVTVSGRDNQAIQTVGMTVLGISPSRGDTLLRDTTVTYSPPQSGTVEEEFFFSPFNVDSLAIPDTLVYEVTGFLVDVAGNCAASTGEDDASLECTTLTVGGSSGRVAQGTAGLRLEREVVAGRTVLLPAGGRVMDAAVDAPRRDLYLSNIDQNRLEVFRLDTEVFGTGVAVGSQPWGLSLVPDFEDFEPDSLVVANSNGTNMEMVELGDVATADPEDRFFFPDAVLFDVIVEEGETGINVVVNPIPDFPNNLDFSDRPQFIAVDTFGNRIFSTVAVDGLEEVGTVRKAFFTDGWEQTETKIFVSHAKMNDTEDAIGIAHVDAAGANGSVLTVVDHVPGFPQNEIVVTIDLAAEPLSEVATRLAAAGSDALVRNGTWNVNNLGFNDTTFVAASGDGTSVVIGEGAEPEIARVLLHAAGRLGSTDLTGSIRVGDLITQRPGPVRGVGLNYDGTVGVVRGDDEVAFFDSGLRKLGGVLVPGGAGAALHPLHANQPTLFNAGEYRPNTHLAFVGTEDGTIDIIDTFRFLRIGSIRIRDLVAGPLRAVMPFPSDNAGFTCTTDPVTHEGTVIGEAVRLYSGNDFNSIVPETVTEDRCVVVKLFAVTDAGGVVVVDLRKSDVLRLHPQRR